jgi:hypothetical protein
MTVKSEPVQVARADGNEAVIAWVLAPGLLVFSAGVHVLSPGQKVTLFASSPTPPAAPAAPATSVAPAAAQ